MLLEAERLYLRKFTLDDIEKTYLYSQEKSRKKGIPNEVYPDIQAAKEIVEFIISNYDKKDYPYVFAVVLKDTDEYIGHVSLSRISYGVEIGYAICEKYQGQGFATEAVKAYVTWSKQHLDLEKIYGLTYPDNEASINVLQKAEFVFLKDDADGEFIKSTHF